MENDALDKLTAILEGQQQQIDDIHRLLVTLADAVVAQRDTTLPAALDRHTVVLTSMIERGEQLQREAIKRAQDRTAEVQRIMRGGG